LSYWAVLGCTIARNYLCVINHVRFTDYDVVQGDAAHEFGIGHNKFQNLARIFTIRLRRNEKTESWVLIRLAS